MSGELARLAGEAARALALRDCAGAPAGPRGGGPVGLHEPQPSQARGPQPAAGAASGARLHARRAGRAGRRAGGAATGRCPPSSPPPGCGPRNGPCSSAATSTAAPGAERAPHGLAAARWWSWRKTNAAAARCRCPTGRSPRSTRCRRGSTRRYCSPRPRGGPLEPRTTSAAASGHRRSRRPGSPRPARIYDLRSTFAIERARRRRLRVRAGTADGHVASR